MTQDSARQPQRGAMVNHPRLWRKIRGSILEAKIDEPICRKIMCFLFDFCIHFSSIFNRKSDEHPMKIDRKADPKNDVNRNRENNENCNGASTRMKKTRWQYVKKTIKKKLTSIEKHV